MNQPVFSPKNYRDTLVEMLRLRGRMDAEAYVQDVPADWKPPAPDPGAGDPNMVIAKAEEKKADAKIQQMGQESQLKMAQAAAESQTKIHQLEIQLQKMQAEAELARRESAMEMELKWSQLAATIETQRLQIEATNKMTIRQQDLQADIQREKHALESGVQAGADAATDKKG